MSVTSGISFATIFESISQSFFTFFLYKGWIVGLIVLVLSIVLHIVRKKKGASKKELLVYKIFMGISILIVIANIVLFGIVIYAISTMDLSFLSVTELM